MWKVEQDPDWAGGGFVQCTHCKYGFSFACHAGMQEFDYCPHCGKRNKEADDGVKNRVHTGR